MSAVGAATSVNLDTVAGSLLKSGDFNMGSDIIDMGLGQGAFSGGAAFPTNLEVMINGITLRPVLDAGKIKTFVDGATISFAGLQGDFVFYKNTSGPVYGIAFGFALKVGDEIQVRYFNN